MYVPDSLFQTANVCCDIFKQILGTDKNYDFWIEDLKGRTP
jgi:hypothetical protein